MHHQNQLVKKEKNQQEKSSIPSSGSNPRSPESDISVTAPCVTPQKRHTNGLWALFSNSCRCLANRTHPLLPHHLIPTRNQFVTESLLSPPTLPNLPKLPSTATSPLYEEAATSGCCLSSMLAFSRSAAASAAASFSWASSAPALASPLAPCFSAAGFRPFSVVPWAASDSASRRSISACALAMF